jgi:EAL domain-containing protein (putative c-di-GMP-specific phosphodiesterase class I)
MDDRLPRTPVGCAGCRGGEGLGFAIRAAFHPILDLETERVFAYEALVRGEAGEGAAEVIDRVTSAQRYSFDQACRVTAIREAVAAGIIATGARLSINFLPNAVYSPKACIQLTLATARETGFPPERLIFEFTENEKIETEHLQAIIAAYRALGFGTAIDDFGAGHAGLALLADLPTDLVKLDMALVRGIDRDPRRRAITETTVGLIRRLGADVIAEGVETVAELEIVRLMGVRFVQGFLFGQPALGRLDAFPDWLRRGSGAAVARAATG